MDDGQPNNGNDPETKVKEGSTELTAAYVWDAYERGSNALRKAQYDYALNKSYLGGEQWLYYDKARNSLIEMPRSDERTRVTLNRLWPISRHQIARLISRPIQYEVPPGDSDDASVRGAQTAEAVIKTLARDHNWENIREEVAWSAWIGGTAAIAVDWDPTRGSVLGNLPLSGESFGTGEIVETTLSISELCFEPGTRNIETGLWWIKAQALPPHEVKALFKMDHVPEADSSGALTPAARRAMHGADGNSENDMTLVLTYYERPNPSRPKGAVAVIIGDKVVGGVKEWPFKFKDHLNLVVVRETKVPGQAHGSTILSAAVPIQTAFNASWSNVIEHMKRAGNARIMVPEGSVDSFDDFSDLAAEFVMYSVIDGAKPDYMSPPQMPQWWVEEPDRLAREMDDTLGLHDVSRGSAPANIESGVGLSVLTEADGTPLGKLVNEMAAAFERLATMCLTIYAEKVTESRPAKIIANQVPESINWTGKSLHGQLQVEIPIDAVMPRSHAAMLAMAKELWDRKMITDPEQFADLAQLPDSKNLLDRLNRDAAKAIRENDGMANGRVMLPAEFDQHDVHIKRHNDFRKTTRYETLSEKDKQVVDMHIQAHETMAAEQMGLQAAKANVVPVAAAIPTAVDAPTLPPGMGTYPGEPAPGGQMVDETGAPPLDANVVSDPAAQAPPPAQEQAPQ